MGLHVGYDCIHIKRDVFSSLQPVSKWFVNSGWRCMEKKALVVYIKEQLQGPQVLSLENIFPKGTNVSWSLFMQLGINYWFMTFDFYFFFSLANYVCIWGWYKMKGKIFFTHNKYVYQFTTVCYLVKPALWICVCNVCVKVSQL